MSPFRSVQPSTQRGAALTLSHPSRPACVTKSSPNNLDHASLVNHSIGSTPMDAVRQRDECLGLYQAERHHRAPSSPPLVSSGPNNHPTDTIHNPQNSPRSSSSTSGSPAQLGGLFLSCGGRPLQQPHAQPRSRSGATPLHQRSNHWMPALFLCRASTAFAFVRPSNQCCSHSCRSTSTSWPLSHT